MPISYNDYYHSFWMKLNTSYPFFIYLIFLKKIKERRAISYQKYENLRDIFLTRYQILILFKEEKYGKKTE